MNVRPAPPYSLHQKIEANVVAAIQVAKRLGPGKTVVTIMVDSGLRYLSTDLYRS